MKKNHITLFGPILIILFVTIGVLLPLLKPGFIVTDDGDWMVIRLTAFYQAFADGQFPVRFLARLNNNYGYPVANFLYPGFLYIGSMLRLLKMPYPTIVECIMGGSVTVSAVFLYLWLTKFFSIFPSLIGTLSFLFSPYLLFDMYKRGSVGELLGTAFVMILLWSIESGFVWLIPLITAMFLLSHNTLSLLLSVIVAGYVIVRKKWDSVIPLAIGVCITSFFWIPAFFERSFIRFDSVVVAEPFDYYRISQTLLLMSFPFFVPLFLFFKKKKKNINRSYIFFSCIAIVSVLGSSFLGMMVWKTMFFVRFVQFPYRTLSLLFIAGPWLLAFFMTQLKQNKKLWIGGIFVFVLFLFNIELLRNVKSIVREEGFYTTNEGTTTVQDEYMPRWVKDKPGVRADDKLSLFSGKGVFTVTKDTTKRIDATLKLEQESIIQFNSIYYPGWGAMVDGKPAELLYQNPKGVIQVIIPKGDHVVSFEFRETAFRYIADLLSSLGVLFYGIYIVFLLSKGVKRKTSV